MAENIIKELEEVSFLSIIFNGFLVLLLGDEKNEEFFPLYITKYFLKQTITIMIWWIT